MGIMVALFGEKKTASTIEKIKNLQGSSNAFVAMLESTVSELTNVNEEIEAQNKVLDEEIKTLQDARKEATTFIAANSKIVDNINSILK